MRQSIKIGTRDSQLAVWQATLVQSLLHKNGIESELVLIKSQGDIDTTTPLYELGVQGIFTRSLDAAMLNEKVDIAVHSLKDVPTKLAEGIRQAAVLKRASPKDIFVYKNEASFLGDQESTATIATSSTRRIAQWLHRYPKHRIENLRGNVNTRLRKVAEEDWNGAIFAAAGLERIGLRPENSVDLDWMLPAPAQGAITIVCRNNDNYSFEACRPLHDPDTALCTGIERDFLRALLGGCSTPISAFAHIVEDTLIFKGSICSTDGRDKIDIERGSAVGNSLNLGNLAGKELLKDAAAEKIIYGIRKAKE